MGLYDNYKVNLSNTVKPFAGSIVPELKQMKSEMDTAAYKTLDTTMSTQNLIASTPTLDIDKEAFDAISNEAQSKIDAISNSGDLANSVVDASILANQTARRLNSLASRHKEMDAFKSSIKDYTPDVQEYLVAETQRQSGPAKFDPKTQRAQPLTPVTPAKQLKDDEMVRQAVIATVKQKGITITDSEASSATYDKDKNSYKIQTSRGIEEIPASDLMKQLDNALKASQEWNASINQDAKARAYHMFKDVSEERAKEEITDPKTSYGKRAQEIFQKGNITAKDALEQAATEVNRFNKIQDLKQYAAGAASRDLKETNIWQSATTDKDVTGSSKKAKESEYLAGLRTGTTAPTDVGLKTSQDLTTEISQYDADIASLDQQIAQAEKDINAGGDAAINASSRLEMLKNEKYEKTNTKLGVVAKNEVILDEEARRLKRKSWSELKSSTGEKVKNNLTNYLPAEEVAKVTEAVLNDNITFKKVIVNESAYYRSEGVSGYKLAAVINGKEYDIKTTERILDAKNDLTKDLKEVKTSAKNKKASPDNVQDSSIPVVGEMRTSLSATLSNAAFYALDNKTNQTSKALEEGNLEKAQVVSYNPRLNRLTVVSPNGTYYATAGEHIRELLAADLEGLDNPSLKQMGKNLRYNLAPVYEAALSKGSSVVKYHPAFPNKEIPIVVNKQEYGIKRVSDDRGTRFVIVNLSTGLPESIPYDRSDPSKLKKNFTFPEIETFLNNLIANK